MTTDPDFPGQTIKGDCKFPLGSGSPQAFCGRPVLRARCPYCEEHAERAFIAVDPLIQKKFVIGAIRAAERG